MKCVIIGAAGFIGRHLAAALVDAGHDVHGLDTADALRASAPASPDAARFRLEAGDASADDLRLPRADAVFYLAQSPFFREFPRRADHLFAVNVTGALRAAEAAGAGGATFFLYASSGTVYRSSFAPMAEDHAVRRDQGYALSKLCAEEALALMAERMTIVCARFFGVYGPGQQAGLVPDIADRIRGRRPVLIERHPRDRTDLDGLRISLTYVRDLAACVARLLALAADGEATPPVLNAAAEDVVSIRRLATAVGAELGIAPSFDVTDRARESDYVADVTRLKSVVAARFTPFEEAIADALTVTV